MRIGNVTFVGAGPGAPDLLTLRGKKAIEDAQLVLYAGRMISPAILALTCAEKHDTAELELEEAHDLVKRAVFAGRNVARLHSGDPSIYGAMAEQIELLDRDGIPWRVVPGITAAMAAAAVAGIDFSIPGVNQSLIITRLGGSMPMPPNEDLATLAAHGTAMAVYMAGHRCGELQQELEQALPPETPIICASRIGWPEEQIIYTALGSLGDSAALHDLGRQTVILVLPGEGIRGSRARHYNPVLSYRSSAGG